MAVESCESLGCPPRLAAAIRYAVFPGGARIRPRLCLAIAAGCGEPQSPLAEATAASIELLHCASLVHDDLPCFDDAEFRRNRPSVHRAFDERIALLVGDALIVLAFQNVARAYAQHPLDCLASFSPWGARPAPRAVSSLGRRGNVKKPRHWRNIDD